MKPMWFSEILGALNLQMPDSTADFEVSGISTDTRTLKRGDLFVALNGENYRGSDFAEVAENKGACAIISSDPIQARIPVALVSDTLRAYQEIASYYRKKFDIPVIAVTGSNGKTTTSKMIYSILSTKKRVLISERNYNNVIGVPKTILCLDDSYECAIFEMGMNHSGEIDTLSRMANPHIAVITNIGKAHIGLLHSQENIRSAKFEIVNGLDPDGLLILNGEDPYLCDYYTGEKPVQYIGNHASSRLSAQDIQSSQSSISFSVTADAESCFCRIPTIGTHNVYNALEAICVALQFDFTLEEACAALSHYEAVPMRSEVSYDKGITIIKDYYNASPESCEAAINALKQYKSFGKRIAILGEMYELGQYSYEAHQKLAMHCSENLDFVFFLGEDYEAVRLGLGATPNRCCPESERQQFLESLLSFINRGEMNEGDIVLIKGSRAMHMEEIYEYLKSYINAIKSDYIALPPSPTRLYVDIDAIKSNFFQISQSLDSGVEIMPMVKANAYGCGADIIANVFKVCKYLAVADVKEAAMIRRILPQANIMIIYQPVERDIRDIVAGGFIPAICDLNFACALNREAERRGVLCKVHIEVDTGMGRLGIRPSECTDFAKALLPLKNLETDGIFMHYACADSFTEEDLAFTTLQTQRFAQAIREIEDVLGPVNYKHACAGAAIFNQNVTHYNMVRPGYMLYGYYPSEALRSRVLLKPALKFVSVISKITEYEPGASISYNRRFVTKRRSRIATVAVGYSDGIYRRLFDPSGRRNGCFVVNGQRAPIVGTICMDLTMIDITDIEGSVSVGDEVAIFDNENVTIDEMAEICDTIGYEIIARIEDKADRVEAF